MSIIPSFFFIVAMRAELEIFSTVLILVQLQTYNLHMNTSIIVSPD